MGELAERKNEGKCKLAMIPLDCHEWEADGFEYGAKKYTKKILISQENLLSLCQLWEKLEYVRIVSVKSGCVQEDCAIHATIKKRDQLRNVKNAIESGKLKAKEYVEVAQKELGSKRILKKKLQDPSTSKSIPQNLKIERKSVRDLKKDIKIQNMLVKSKEMNFLEDYLNTGYQKIFISKSVKKVAKFATAKKDYTSIMIIKVGSSEVFFVANAIKELDCLTTIFSVLKKLQIISKDLEIESDKIVMSKGQNNWRKGLLIMDQANSLFRHLSAFLHKNEDIDPESKVHHLGLAQCNLSMMVNTLKNHPELDDRFKQE